MFLVLVLHANCVAQGFPDKEAIMSSGGASFFRLSVQALSLVCVNVFVLISGWFGINPNKKKLFSFLFQVFFFTVIVNITCSLIGVGDPLDKDGVAGMFLFGKYQYWFVKSYLLLYILSPVINTFVQNVSKSQLLMVVLSLLLVQTVYGWTGTMPEYDRGFSAISFISLYLLARYVRIYGGKWFNLSRVYDLFAYVGFSILTAVAFFIFKKAGFDSICGHLYIFINPFAIAASLYLLLYFSKLSFNSRVINYIAQSAFAVYLFHVGPIIWKPFLEQCWNVSLSYSGFQKVGMLLLVILSVYILAIMLDQVRLFCWNRISCTSFLQPEGQQHRQSDK